MNRFANNGYLSSALIVVTAALVLGGSQPPAKGQCAGRPKSTGSKSTNSNERSSSAANSRERARAERERRRRAEAAAAAADEAREAQARADREEERERTQVWMLAVIYNRTDHDITYQCDCNGSWSDNVLKPGHGHQFNRRDKAAVVKFQSGSGEKRVVLNATRVVGHKPTEDDERQSKVNYFQVDENGDLHLYGEP